MTRRAYTIFTISTCVMFVTGMIFGLLISSVGDMPSVRGKEYIEIEAAHGGIVRLSKEVVTELSHMGGELWKAQEISDGIWRIMFTTDDNSDIRVRQHPGILETAVMLKECDGKLNYGHFFRAD